MDSASPTSGKCDIDARARALELDKAWIYIPAVCLLALGPWTTALFNFSPLQFPYLKNGEKHTKGSLLRLSDTTYIKHRHI